MQKPNQWGEGFLVTMGETKETLPDLSLPIYSILQHPRLFGPPWLPACHQSAGSLGVRPSLRSVQAAKVTRGPPSVSLSSFGMALRAKLHLYLPGQQASADSTGALCISLMFESPVHPCTGTLQVAAPRLSRRSSVTVRADGFIGSTNNLVRAAHILDLHLRLVHACGRAHWGAPRHFD